MPSLHGCALPSASFFAALFLAATLALLNALFDLCAFICSRASLASCWLAFVPSEKAGEGASIGMSMASTVVVDIVWLAEASSLLLGQQ